MFQKCNRGKGDPPHNNAVIKFVRGVAALMIMVRFDNSNGRRMTRTDGQDRPDTRTALTKKIVQSKQTARTNGPNGRTSFTKHVKFVNCNKTPCKIRFETCKIYKTHTFSKIKSIVYSLLLKMHKFTYFYMCWKHFVKQHLIILGRFTRFATENSFPMPILCRSHGGAFGKLSASQQI